MLNFLKRSLSTILSLVIVITLFCNINTQAVTVNYVYGEGKYIKNWGIREQTASFLSQNAEAFYQKNQTSYEALSLLSGSRNENQIPSSELYLALHDLMDKNQTFITDYAYTRYKYQYTDIQNSGIDSNKISSFYSGVDIGPEWDYGDTWNREHTWPNSKGDKAGDGENDIMMLRPTAADENLSRSNIAYGKSSGYYNPNSESGGKHDLRGDVARIMLYQYVRWECTNTGEKYNPNGIFGTKGVIESKEVLLEWIEADPVDTWELGRNDSVESITGTRNVFVDYPELAFILFDEQVPSNYQTPSGNALGDVTPSECSHYYHSNCDTDCDVCGLVRKVYISHSFTGGICSACGLQVESGIVGDVNSDKKVNIRDYIIIMRYLNDWDVELITNTADINNDGSVNGRDCALLIQYVNEWKVNLPSMGSSILNDSSNVSGTNPVPSLKLVIVDTPVVGTAYKFGFESTSSTNGGTYYAAGGMNGYYMATTTSIETAIDVYLEEVTDGYCLYTIIDGKKKYMNIKSTGAYVNAVYEDAPGAVLKYDTVLKTLVVNALKNGKEDEYAFGTWSDYTTIGTTQTAKDGYFCHFYK